MESINVMEYEDYTQDDMQGWHQQQELEQRQWIMYLNNLYNKFYEYIGTLKP